MDRVFSSVISAGPSDRAIQALKDEEIGSMIFTSGTLSPLSVYMDEIGLKDRSTIKLTGGHVINQNQLLVATIGESNGTELKNVFQNRENGVMYAEMGSIIEKVQSVTSGGVLVFHPTYKLMNIATQFWPKLTVLNESTDGMDITLAQFENALLAGQTPILQGVCRGKISEGVDFADNRGRVCFITGIPYAPMMEPKVKLKIASIGKRFNWYQVQAMRAINQAVGRIIRHRFDYGAIIFLDSRFRNHNMRKFLPKWVDQNHLFVDSSEDLRLKCRIFFNKMRASTKRWARIKVHEVTTSLDAPRPEVKVKIEQKGNITLGKSQVTNLNETQEERSWKRSTELSTAPEPKRQKLECVIDERYTELCGHIEKKKFFHTNELDKREELKYFLVFVKGLLCRAMEKSDLWHDFRHDISKFFVIELEHDQAVKLMSKWSKLFVANLGHYLSQIIMVFTIRMLKRESYYWLDEIETNTDITFTTAWDEIVPIAEYFIRSQ